MKRTHLSLAIGLVFGLAVLPSTRSANAADAAAPNVERLDEVTVTARRREENVQKVPVAVSTFSERDLIENQASKVDDLQGSVPNLNIVEGRGSSSAINVFIRGIGQPDALQTFDPGVGIYVDDVYYSRIQGALFSLYDVDHIEVLRGPQGTLYGKNSTGGAIKVVTKEPGDHTEGSVELTVGNYGKLESRAYVATPLSPTWGISAAVIGTGNDGYVEDPVTHKNYNDDDTQAIRLKLVGKPSDTFKAVFSVDYTHQNNGLTLGRPTAPLVRTDFGLGAIVLLPAPTGEYNFETRTSFSPDQGQKLIHKGASATLSWNLSDSWMFKSITAYRKLTTKAYVDIDASQFQLGDVFVGIDQSQFSQELQAQYDNGSNLTATYGVYYLKEKVPSLQYAYASDLFAFLGTPIHFLRSVNDDLRTTSYAGYGQVNWEFTPSWTLGAGLRYTHETKDYFRTTSTFSDNIPSALFAILNPAFNATYAFDTSDSWTALTPSLSLQKAFSDHVMGYVSANRGFKSGGFNGRANSPAEVSSFKPEYVWTYEAGLKTSSADGRLLGNFTVFHSNYSNFQARVSEVLNPGSPTPTFAFPVLNAAKLTMDGVEFEGTALLGQGTRLSGQVGYMNAKYDEFDDPRVALNPALASLHDHVAFAPKWTARFAASQTFAAGDKGNITLGGDISYRDDTWLSVDNRPGLFQSGYALVGLYGIWDSTDTHWQVRAGVRNLNDKVYKTEAQEFSSVGNIQTAYFGTPRTYYLTARYNFE
ncbi:MAG: TonB-dependent receptor [Dokdonella sp.]